MEVSGQLHVSAANLRTELRLLVGLVAEWAAGPVWMLRIKKCFCRLWENKLHLCLPNMRVKKRSYAMKFSEM